MCQKATCRKCQKATYRGCGMHVDQVLAAVPQSQRCTCTKDSKDSAPAGNLWKRILGRG